MAMCFLPYNLLLVAVQEFTFLFSGPCSIFKSFFPVCQSLSESEFCYPKFLIPTTTTEYISSELAILSSEKLKEITTGLMLIWCILMFGFCTFLVCSYIKLYVLRLTKQSNINIWLFCLRKDKCL